MTFLRHLLPVVIAGLCATLAHAAGFAVLHIPADKDGPALRGAVWSPCRAPAGPIPLGPIVVQGTRDCPLDGTKLPLIVVSHGTGGSFLGHHDTAAALADAGFVVAAISHPGGSFQDLDRQGHLSAFATRPVDMRRLVDHMVTTWPEHARLDAGRIGLFGFSRGGYTGLAVLGAVPNWTLREDLCPPESALPLCGEIRRREWPAAPARDRRIQAAVIVDPLSVFDARGLARIDVPIQLWASERGGDGVTPASVEAVRRGLPMPPEWHVAANASHFVFLAPCSPALDSLAPGICRDDSGFDRIAFHAAFNDEVRAFFQRHLGRDRTGSGALSAPAPRSARPRSSTSRSAE